MEAETSSKPSFAEALALWGKIGVLSFGGPAGQIALMHRLIVDERRWISEQRFLHALNFCMLLPGPEAMQLATYIGWRLHGTIGGLVARFDATVGVIEGDGVQLFFNDPIEVPDAALRATRLGCALRAEMAELMPIWRKRGYDLDFGAGIALGYATCGEVGFEGRSDYAAIGAVTNLASRLADEATAGQLLITQRLHAEVEDDIEVEAVGEFTLKGFQRPVAAFNVLAVREQAMELASPQTTSLAAEAQGRG